MDDVSSDSGLLGGIRELMCVERAQSPSQKREVLGSEVYAGTSHPSVLVWRRLHAGPSVKRKTEAGVDSCFFSRLAGT